MTETFLTVIRTMDERYLKSMLAEQKAETHAPDVRDPDPSGRALARSR